MRVLFLLLFPCFVYSAPVELGVDVFFNEHQVDALKGKRVGLVTNHTGVNGSLRSTIDLFLEKGSGVQLVALFTPEHGLNGNARAAESVEDKKDPSGLPIYSLHGKTRRPTSEMLKNIDVLIYDIQDIGCRSYTYTTTLFYVMEEAAKHHISVIVLDRPNPINGVMVDGPMLQEKWRSYIGYVNIPYCHGMTVGELALFFNAHYAIGCSLEVVKMKGWKRTMSFADTGLTWIPPSPHIPEADTPYYYATTGLLGELSLVNIGVGYTLPFKVIGAPWIDAKVLARTMNAQHLPGAHFIPFYYKPFYGPFKEQECEGTMVVITDPLTFRPVTTQYMLLGILKNLYPKQVLARLDTLESAKQNLFCKANGNEEMFTLLRTEPYVAWKLITFQKAEKEQFLAERKLYLLYH